MKLTRSQRWLTTRRIALAAALPAVLAVSMVGAQPAFAAKPHAPAKATAQKTPSVAPGEALAAAKQAPDPTAKAAIKTTPSVTWPASLDTTVSMSPALATTSRHAVRIASTPIAIDAPITAGSHVHELTSGQRAATPSAVHVQVLDHATATKAHQSLVIRVAQADDSRAASRVNVTIDYSSFRDAFGADWASRLRLVELPTCATTTPDVASCQPVPLQYRNDSDTSTVTATVKLAPATAATGTIERSGTARLRPIAATPNVTPAATSTTAVVSQTSTAAATTLALTSGPSGSAGDFTATPVKASETWTGGTQSGNFTWNYPMRVPPANAGPQPTVSLNYSSQSVDGEMAASNNQPSWVGEGFSYQPGAITRDYKACSDDMGGTATNATKTGDLCWGSYNATLSLDGHSSEIIRDDSDGHYSLKNDDGSKVELLTGATNGDNNGEYWRVTTTDGTQYYFGLNHIAGWATGEAATNSAWTVPVYGNNSGEPCYNASFASAYCQQAWRWNLDYVVNPHGNTESFWYTQETNNYARDNTKTTVSSYTRDGYLTRIDYGTDQHSGTDTDFSAKSPYSVAFTVADRCVTAGSTCTSSTPSNWPDVPWDQSCTSTTSCTDYAPTFFSQKRLDTVQTSVWNTTSAKYDAVETWTLHQTYPDPGDSTRAGLWLSSISHSGVYGGTAATVPDVKFEGIQLKNRVDTSTDAEPAMNWWRVSAITSETGEKIGISYSDAQCVAGSTPSPSANTSRCYPIYWTRPGASSPTIDWFNKYVVTAVSENDLTGGAPRIYTTYAYGTPAWHYDEDDGIVPASRKTWAEWRGYDTVTTTVGDTGDPATSTKTLFFQGMNGDKAASGTKSAQVTDSTGTKISDDDAYSGMARETITFNGPGGAEVSGEIDDPWKSSATATRTINGYTVSAYHLGTSAVHDRTDLDASRGLRQTETDTTFDSYGMPTQIWDKGDISKSTDDTCTITTYNRNTSKNILETVGRTQNYAKPCGTSPASADDVISDVENSFDGQTYGTAPTKGDITTTQTAKDWASASSVTWLTTATSVYDAYGRVTDTTDVRGNHTLTAYTPATGGPVTAIKTTQNPLGWVSTKEIAPGYGLPTGAVDVNNKRTDTTYDGLGRVAAVWTPTRSKSANASANITYSYSISQSVPSVTTTNKLNSQLTYVPTYTFYDGLTRQRQVQSVAPGGGRLITDTFYNSVGETIKASGPYFNSDAPGITLFAPPLDLNVPSQTLTTFDGVGRAVKSAFVAYGYTQWHTTTTYGGDHTDVTPAVDAAAPSAGTPTSTYTDALGHTTELRQYPGTSVTGTSYNSTKYAFNEKGQNSSTTDNAGNTWSYKYDLLGRTVSSTDPDTGTTTNTYDDAGDITSTKDALGQTVSYDYTLPAGYADPLGRKTAEWAGAISTGTKLATWTYDTLSKGYLSSSSRFTAAGEYKTAILGYNNLYQVAGTLTTIPSAEGNLAGTYSTSATYNIDGTINSQSLPAIGDLTVEGLNYTYDKTTGNTYSLSSNYGGTSKQIVLSTAYTSYDEPAVTTFADSATSPYVQQSLTYDESTHRVSEATTFKSTSPSTVTDTHLTYDASGNITKSADTPSGGTAETQCFTYDGLQRLTSAWTPASGDCSATTATAALGGAAPYWKSWTFDGTTPANSTGNRLTETTHAAAGDTVVTSAYAQANHPHGLSGTTAVSGGTTTTASYVSDADGNTISRPGNNGQQTLTWDTDGHLSTLQDGSGTSSYIYNADGSRLLAHDPGGTTLYIGDTELRLTNSTGAKTAQRYYTYNGVTIAQRTAAAGLQYLTNDPDGTSSTAVADSTTQAVTKRYLDPYGNTVSSTATWTGAKSFVGGDQDPTTLVHEGAREYDPAQGRFISRDSVVDTADPQQMNGYAYANDNPTTYADPSGDILEEVASGEISQAQVDQITGHSGTWDQYRTEYGTKPTGKKTAGRDFRVTKSTLFGSGGVYDEEGELVDEDDTFRSGGGYIFGETGQANQHIEGRVVRWYVARGELTSGRSLVIKVSRNIPPCSSVCNSLLRKAAKIYEVTIYYVTPDGKVATYGEGYGPKVDFNQTADPRGNVKSAPNPRQQTSEDLNGTSTANDGDGEPSGQPDGDGEGAEGGGGSTGSTGSGEGSEGSGSGPGLGYPMPPEY